MTRTRTLLAVIAVAVIAAAAGAGGRHVSRIDLLDLRLPREVGPCPAPWWSDQDHFSAEGARAFG
ncbi:MAG: hypothetical protein N3D71_05075, partial [Burkholderiaceae bacterium]|nr:hypothetical protein [Burkholderiaceae bacterium]